MAKNKRKSTASESQDNSKRSRPSNDSPRQSATYGRVDPTYGQRSAFPGLDDEDVVNDVDEELHYGEEFTQALRYLRAVRSVLFHLLINFYLKEPR
jgi:hypothetical protein